MPMTRVGRCVPPRCAASEPSISISVCPPAGTPRMCLTWLVAIKSPEAVMKPAITGWLRKLAMKPSRRRPRAISMIPDSSASVSAAAA